MKLSPSAPIHPRIPLLALLICLGFGSAIVVDDDFGSAVRPALADESYGDDPIAVPTYSPFYWDSDGDGIADFWDQCPFEWGSYPEGCVPPSPIPSPSPADEQDYDLHDTPIANPEWTPSYNIDEDGDGIENDDDACPSTPGEASCAGCPCTPTPEPSPFGADSDGDGFPDYYDYCPADPGQYYGCPEYPFSNVGQLG